jgi:hypothetical protein
MTIPVGIQSFMQQYSTDRGSLMAPATLAMVPTLILFLFIQKYLISGALAGAVKPTAVIWQPRSIMELTSASLRRALMRSHVLMRTWSRTPKSDPSDFLQDLELFTEMAELMRDSR